MARVSIIIPCYNEERRIGEVLAALHAQDYPRSELEVIIADGLSTDRTREMITTFQEAHPELAIRVVDNHVQTIPAALNTAIEAAQGEIILRMDAHSVPYPDYVANSVAGLESGLGANVGGVWEIMPGANTWIARSIAVAAAHPLGVGDAYYRHTNKAQVVDTVPFGAFYKSLVTEIGGYDESLLANEDYEFNARVRKAGRTVYLDPAIRAKYYARPTLKTLAQQYWRYGSWKVRMLQRYPDTLRWRQMLPPLFVLGLIIGGLLGLWLSGFKFIWLAVVVSYGLALLIAGSQRAIKDKQWLNLVGIPLAIATMHISWGAAFLWHTFHLARRN